MIQVNFEPRPGPDRSDKLAQLQGFLRPILPHLAGVVNDMGPLDLLLFDPSLRGKPHAVWLTDGQVSDPIEMEDVHPLSGATFALQLEILSLQDTQSPGRHYFAWNALMLHVVGDYDPRSVVEKIVGFMRGHDAYVASHFLARKISNPPDFDFRTQRPSSLEQYLGVVDNIAGKALLISTKRQVAELERFISGDD